MSLVTLQGKCAGEVGEDVYKPPSTFQGDCSKLFNSKNYVITLEIYFSFI
jgi:hypothetical protein